MNAAPGVRTGPRTDRPVSHKAPGVRSDERWSADLRNRRDIKTPDSTSYGPGPHNTVTPGRDHNRRHRPRGYGYGSYRRHHHYYGCGHYGYGHYDPYYYDHHHSYYGHYSPFSAFFFGGLGYNRYAPDIYISGGGGSVSRQEAEMGALDLDIKPRQAEVYLDGQFIGTVDQYDGYPTYLWLEEGTYEVALYLPGHETIFRQYTIYPGVIIDVDDRMREGSAIRPDAPEPSSGYGAYPEETYPQDAYPSPETYSQQTLPQETVPQTGPSNQSPSNQSQVGRVAIQGSPADAVVYLDGHFVGTAAEISSLAAGLIVEPGDHVIELVRPGYETQRVPVSIPVGERIDLRLDLSQQ